MAGVHDKATRSYNNLSRLFRDEPHKSEEHKARNVGSKIFVIINKLQLSFSIVFYAYTALRGFLDSSLLRALDFGSLKTLL
jgi:hypothetical protein